MGIRPARLRNASCTGIKCRVPLRYAAKESRLLRRLSEKCRKRPPENARNAGPPLLDTTPSFCYTETDPKTKHAAGAVRPEKEES